MLINEGFIPKRPKNDRLPPGQYETKDFPVLAFGPTPHVSSSEWKLEVFGLAEPTTWTWEEFLKLPMTELHTDIHCVTKWSKFDTTWRGVLLDEIMKRTKVKEHATYLVAHSYDGYSTNVPLEDVHGTQAMVAVEYEHDELSPEHGGPARLLVPHLYFWKSAKWLKGIEFIDHDEPGFWETKGYHNYGDPWKEQRYSFD
jgi:DMSO/TMAO reductase YedYZ molybdopterin-dependent catalytic subunit